MNKHRLARGLVGREHQYGIPRIRVVSICPCGCEIAALGGQDDGTHVPAWRRTGTRHATIETPPHERKRNE